MTVFGVFQWLLNGVENVGVTGATLKIQTYLAHGFDQKMSEIDHFLDHFLVNFTTFREKKNVKTLLVHFLKDTVRE